MSRKAWADLTASDNFVFQAMMENIALCQGLIELILGKSIPPIKIPETERTFAERQGSKTIRLDVFTVDDLGDLYDMEMQPHSIAIFVLTKRLRYYISVLDMWIAKTGQRYDELNDITIIFICLFDPAGFGEAVNELEVFFKGHYKEQEKVDMGVRCILLNAKAWKKAKDPELRAFLHYIATGVVEGKFVEALHEEFLKVKCDERVEAEYMSLREELYSERKKGKEEGIKEGMKKGMKKGMKEGKKEGIFETQLNSIRILINKFKCSLEEAMESLCIPVAERATYRAALIGG